MKLNNKSRWLTGFWALFVLLFMFFCAGCASEKKDVNSDVSEIHFIDTGNSDAILIKQGEYAALIDGGDNDDEILLPRYLQEQGVKTLEYLFITHPDADHIGGLDGVIHAMKVKKVYVGNGKAETKTYTDVVDALMSRDLTPSVPFLNSELSFGSSTFKVLSVAHAQDINNTSLVLLFTNGQDKVLFMGDAGQNIEKKLQVGPVDLIKLGHHGSKDSSSKSFLEQISPQYAVITCGRQNKFGHPHQETMDTLKKLHIPVYRTDEYGSIIFISTGKGIKTDASQGSYTAGSEKVNKVKNQTPQNTFSINSQENKKNKVYFTLKGKKYHSVPNCSGMKEPIEGTCEDAGNREPCEKCYK